MLVSVPLMPLPEDAKPLQKKGREGWCKSGDNLTIPLESGKALNQRWACVVTSLAGGLVERTFVCVRLAAYIRSGRSEPRPQAQRHHPIGARSADNRAEAFSRDRSYEGRTPSHQRTSIFRELPPDFARER